MESSNNEITRLSDDIREIFSNAFGEKSEMVRLCKDHRNLLLHHDKKPVLDITQDDFVGIFDVNFHHFFLPPDQAFRIGQYCSLPKPNLIALMMKAEWEIYLSDCAGFSRDSEINLGLILADQALINACIKGFSPNKKEIIDLIENNPARGSDAGSSVSETAFYIQGLLEGSGFLMKNDHVSNLFPGDGISEKVLLYRTPEPQREEYSRMKELWNIKSTEVDDMLMKLERKKRLNMGIENNYFRTFGTQESDRSKARMQIGRASCRERV